VLRRSDYPANGDDDVEIAGVGDIRMVRTFRVGADGGCTR